MQGKKQYLDKEVTRFWLSERVPAPNLYRRLAELVDWTFLYEETRALYSQTGQPSLDPMVFFKFLLVGRLENLVSDRRLIEHCALRHPGAGTGEAASGALVGSRRAAESIVRRLQAVDAQVQLPGQVPGDWPGLRTDDIL